MQARTDKSTSNEASNNQRGTNQHFVIIILAALLTPAMPALAQQSVTSARPDFSGVAQMQITSDGFKANSPMPSRFSGYAESKSPALQWTAFSGAKSYLIIVEDPDARPATVVHWVIWNIPANVTNLAEGLPQDGRLSKPAGALQGENSHKSVGYAGPHPPQGDPAHHYHFQVFALDRTLDAAAGDSRDKVVAAAAGHVLAKGELIGLYAKD
jgi:Raf kinase inhibitor-like YbhB/YbcL family protein